MLRSALACVALVSLWGVSGDDTGGDGGGVCVCARTRAVAVVAVAVIVIVVCVCVCRRHSRLSLAVCARAPSSADESLRSVGSAQRLRALSSFVHAHGARTPGES